MKQFITSVLLLLSCSCIEAQNETFTETILATGLKNPWELTYGPDNKLWVTEARGYKIQRIDPVSGAKELLLDFSSIMPPGNPQGGMMGLAIHPDFLSGKPYFFLAYVYAFNYDLPNSGGTFFSTRVSRFTCNVDTLTKPITVTLQAGSETIIKDALPGSNDHNSGRLAINSSDRKLYYTIGDMGAGQFNNTNRTNNAQNINLLEGKILRFNIEPDALQTGDNAWIPDDNPFTSGDVPTPVYSYGHRNAQGIVWADFGNGTGKLYSSEHGDRTDDEINEIQKGKNYMWPQVSGFCDGNYNSLTLASKPVNETDDQLTTPAKFCDGAANKKEPLATLFYRSKSEIQDLSPNSSTWPTIAPSSIDFYKNTSAIPGWYPSLLIPSLKRGVIYRIKLNADGTIPVDIHGQPDTIPYFLNSPLNNSPGLYRRWRDVCVSPDGLTIFACVDSVDFSANPGTIFKFVYTVAADPCAADATAPIIVSKNASVNADGSGNASITPSDVIQSITDNCAVDNSTIMLSPSTFSCSSDGNHQSYVSATSTGNQSWTGELGMEFRVNAGSSIDISQLGAFDHEGNGIKGGGVQVAIFKKSTEQIVPGLSVIITGSEGSYINNYRFKSVPPVSLSPGDYVVVAKGYNVNELNGNSSIAQGSAAITGDLDGGAISYIGTSRYGDEGSSGIVYPVHADAGPANQYQAGTFIYSKSNTHTVTITAKDTHGNTATATATVTVVCSAQSQTIALTNAVDMPKADVESNTVSVDLYPNPSSGRFVVKLANMKSPKVTIQILSETGIPVTQKTVELSGRTVSLTVPFNLSSKPSGMYFIRVVSEERVQTKKVVILR